VRDDTERALDERELSAMMHLVLLDPISVSIEVFTAGWIGAGGTSDST
jgi:hypothetical protein